MTTKTGGIQKQIIKGNKEIIKGQIKIQMFAKIITFVGFLCMVCAMFILILSLFGCASRPRAVKGQLVEYALPGQVRVEIMATGWDSLSQRQVEDGIRAILIMAKLPMPSKVYMRVLPGSSYNRDVQAVVSVVARPSYGAKSRVHAQAVISWESIRNFQLEQARNELVRLMGPHISK